MQQQQQRAPSTLKAQSLAKLPCISRSSVERSSGAVKRIHSDADVEVWRRSEAYSHVVLFIARLCEAAVGKPTACDEMNEGATASPSDSIDKVSSLLSTLQRWTEEIEPLKAPQRFGNLAFRTWGARLESECEALHRQLLPDDLYGFIPELQSYFLGAFGSWIRLDYGSGHELSFAAWLCMLHRLGLFDLQMSEGQDAQPPTNAEGKLALQIFPKYLLVAWGLQDRYGLEPAGSHGVWGLDDYQFIPYAIGAAQLREQFDYPPLAVASASHRPDPSPVSPLGLIHFTPVSSPLPDAGQRRLTSASLPGPPFANLYTTSIARIHSLKRGPFHEHSPILHDVATTVPNWVKVHAGMMKMWQAECLNKRPVVQHFPFGGVGFVWPFDAPTTMPASDEKSTSFAPPKGLAPSAFTAAPWTSHGSATRLPIAQSMPVTIPPWANHDKRVPLIPSHAQSTRFTAATQGAAPTRQTPPADRPSEHR